MTEQEFLALAERTLAAIEDAIDASGLDVDMTREGLVLTIEFDDGSRMVVNGQAPTREIWVAAKAGGFHFRRDGDRWVDTRSGDELFAGLSRWTSQQSGTPVVLAAR